MLDAKAKESFRPEVYKKLPDLSYVELYPINPGDLIFHNTVNYNGYEESTYSKLQKDFQTVKGRPCRGTIHEFTHNSAGSGTFIMNNKFRRMIFEAKEVMTNNPWENTFRSPNQEFWVIRLKAVPPEVSEEHADQIFMKHNGVGYDYGQILYFGIEALAEKLGLDTRKVQWFLSKGFICSALMSMQLRKDAEWCSKYLPRHSGEEHPLWQYREPYFRLIDTMNRWDKNNLAPPDNAEIIREHSHLFYLLYERLLTTKPRFEKLDVLGVKNG
jgi:hypothetical protein